MQLHEITQKAGARHRRKRVGRGESSGHGRQSGRGNKGAQARAGGGVRRLTEGGQMPIFRRLPKRGFNNFNFRVEYEIVNLDSLNDSFTDGTSVNLDALREHRLVQGADPMVKILGRGELQRKLTVEAHAFSKTARESIEKAGGSVRVIERKDPAKLAKAKRNAAKKARAAAHPAEAPKAEKPAKRAKTSVKTPKAD